MAGIPNSIPLGGPVAPTDDTDVYPSHFTKYGKGGWRAVLSIAERDAITAERREEGMVVYVRQPVGVEYELVGGITNAHWQVKNTGGGPGTLLNAVTEKFIVDNTILTNEYVDLANTPNTANAHVFVILNGFTLDEGSGDDFTLSNSRVTFEVPLELGDKIIIKYMYN